MVFRIAECAPERRELAAGDRLSARREGHTSLEKALDLCGVPAGAQRGLSVTDLARMLRQPAPTVHRLLGVLKRRRFVRQDGDAALQPHAEDARLELPAAMELGRLISLRLWHLSAASVS